MKLRGLISLRKALPICAMPKGIFTRVESITFFSEEQLRPHVDPATLNDPDYVRASGVLEDVEWARTEDGGHPELARHGCQMTGNPTLLGHDCRRSIEEGGPTRQRLHEGEDCAIRE